MKLKLLLPLLFLIPNIALAKYNFNLELDTCSPSGVINKIKAKVSPAKFWADVAFEIEYGFKEISYGDRLSDTKSTCIGHSWKPKKYAECASRHENYLSSLRRCLHHANLMFRNSIER